MTIRTTIVCVALAGWTSAASAQPVCFSAHLKEQNPVLFGTVGHYVAISGNTAVVGAPGVGGSGQGPIGKAIVFRHSSAAGWEQAQLLTPPDGGLGDGFGRVVAVEEDVMAVSSANWDADASHPGSVYVFRDSGDEWILEQKLFLTDGPDSPVVGFGRTLAIDGGRLAVGLGGGSQVHPDVARVHIYQHDGAQWVQTHVINKEDFSGTFVSFNNASGLAMRGDLLIGGAPADDSACLKDPDWKIDKFGCSFCLSGLAFIFRYDPGSDEWVEEAQLKVEPPKCEQQFGHSVAVDGQRVLIGAKSPHRVYVYEFDVPSKTWVETAQIFAPILPGLQHFASNVDLRGDTALVGANLSGGDYSGFAFVYQRTPSGQWMQREVLSPEPNICCTHYGRSVALADGWAIVGAPGESVGGAAYIYDMQPPIGDLTCDDSVGVNDLLELLGSWGECPLPGDAPGTTGCPGDLNGDGAVGVADLLILLANWG